jgi:hypothetical protein
MINIKHLTQYSTVALPLMFCISLKYLIILTLSSRVRSTIFFFSKLDIYWYYGPDRTFLGELSS